MKTTRLLALASSALLPLLPAAAVAMPAEAPAPTSASASAPTTERPVLRVRDVTGQGSAHRTELLQGYTDCLIEHGAPTIDPSSLARPVPEENISATYGVTLAWPPPADARAACVQVDPVYPPALEAATNPTFAAQAQSYVACMAEQGLHVRLLNDDNLNWTYRAGYDVPDGNGDIEGGCLVGVFGSN